MKYVIDLTKSESNLIWDAVCNFYDDVKDCDFFQNEVNKKLLESIVEKIAYMDETISFPDYPIKD